MKKNLILAALFSLLSTTALAQIYECIDNRGNHSYSEVPNGKNCRHASNLGGNFSTTPAYKPVSSSTIATSNDTKSTTANQPKASDIAKARQNLAEAQKALEEGKKIRLGNERNYVRYQERIKGLEDVVKTRQQELDKAMTNNPTKN